VLLIAFPIVLIFSALVFICCSQSASEEAIIKYYEVIPKGPEHTLHVAFEAGLFLLQHAPNVHQFRDFCL